MTPSPSDRRARGIAMRQARMARISGIRRRVVASALALFVATWLLITMLLISGHDPALARSKTASDRRRAGHHHEHDQRPRARRPTTATDTSTASHDDPSTATHDDSTSSGRQRQLEREQLLTHRADLEPVMSEHPAPDTTPESTHRFDCFGGRCTVIVADGERPG